jgi:hypothetical protein
MSCIEPKAIPRSILPSVEPDEQMVHAISTLCAYALMVRRTNEEIYDLHRLVHIATRVWLGKHGLAVEKTEKAIRYIAMVFPPDDWENLTLWRAYLPHALKLVEGKEGKEVVERYDLCWRKMSQSTRSPICFVVLIISVLMFIILIVEMSYIK